MVARGHAYINDDRFCHGDSDIRPTCYEKVVSLPLVPTEPQRPDPTKRLVVPRWRDRLLWWLW